MFYSNRAACVYKLSASPRLNRLLINVCVHEGYMNMAPPKYELVVQDCDEAIKLDPNYVKALNRRAMAFEALEQYSEALRGTPL